MVEGLCCWHRAEPAVVLPPWAIRVGRERLGISSILTGLASHQLGNLCFGLTQPLLSSDESLRTTVCCFFFLSFFTWLCSYVCFTKSVNCSWRLSTWTQNTSRNMNRHMDLNIYIYFYIPPPTHKNLKQQPNPPGTALRTSPNVYVHRPDSDVVHSFSIPLKRPAHSQSFCQRCLPWDVSYTWQHHPLK